MEMEEAMGIIKQAEELKNKLSSMLETKSENKSTDSVSPWVIGDKYLIRTVTMTLIGKLEHAGVNELVLSTAAWVADSGRFYKALKNGIFESEAEVEPFKNNAIVGRGAIIDATVWDGELVSEAI